MSFEATAGNKRRYLITENRDLVKYKEGSEVKITAQARLADPNNKEMFFKSNHVKNKKIDFQRKKLKSASKIFGSILPNKR